MQDYGGGKASCWFQDLERVRLLRPNRHRFRLIGVSEPEVEAHIALWRAIREGRLGALTDTVERVLNRPPLSLDHWLSENAATFQ